MPGADPLGLNAQVGFAIEESDLLLLVVDGRDGLAAADEQVMERLRGHGRPIVVAVNKSDTRAAREGYREFYALGADGLVLVSAEHGAGLGALHEEVAGHLPDAPPASEPEAPGVAVVGRPNVGKSSLINRLLGSERTLVSPTAGTTRDPIDSLLRRAEGPDYLLVDTAGIRRRSQVQDAPEELAVMLARRQIERAELVVLTVDASHGITNGDLAIGDAAWQAGRPAVIACNKWDLLDEEGRERLEAGWERMAEVFARPARVNVSALSGRGIGGLLPTLDRLRTRHRLRVSTSELNRVARRIVDRHQPPAERGKAVEVVLRGPGTRYASDVSALRQPAPEAGPHLPEVPREPVSRSVRSRGRSAAHRDPGAARRRGAGHRLIRPATADLRLSCSLRGVLLTPASGAPPLSAAPGEHSSTSRETGHSLQTAVHGRRRLPLAGHPALCAAVLADRVSGSRLEEGRGRPAGLRRRGRGDDSTDQGASVRRGATRSPAPRRSSPPSSRRAALAGGRRPRPTLQPATVKRPPHRRRETTPGPRKPASGKRRRKRSARPPRWPRRVPKSAKSGR